MGGSLEWDRITVRGEDSEVRMQNINVAVETDVTILGVIS
jgi:hypothetical protein